MEAAVSHFTNEYFIADIETHRICFHQLLHRYLRQEQYIRYVSSHLLWCNASTSRSDGISVANRRNQVFCHIFNRCLHIKYGLVSHGDHTFIYCIFIFPKCKNWEFLQACCSTPVGNQITSGGFRCLLSRMMRQHTDGDSVTGISEQIFHLKWKNIDYNITERHPTWSAAARHKQCYPFNIRLSDPVGHTYTVHDENRPPVYCESDSEASVMALHFRGGYTILGILSWIAFYKQLLSALCDENEYISLWHY